MDRLQQIWDKVQRFLDIDGDLWMGLFTAAIVYKILHGGLLGPDAAAYGSAIAAFSYTNTRTPK